MLTVIPVEGTPFGDFDGNYYPPQHSKIASIDFLSPPASGDPLTVATNYLKQNLNAFSLTAADLNNFSIGNNYKDTDGEAHVYLQQKYNGLPVADAYAMVNLTANGRVVSASANFADVSYPTAAMPLVPTVTRGAALAAYAEHAGLTPTGSLQLVSGPGGVNAKTVVKQAGVSNDPITMQLQYVPTPTGVDLAWQIIAKTPSKDHWFDVAVAANGPRAGQVIRVGDYVANASYNVFPVPLESPIEGTRAIVIDPQDPIASPFGWHDVNGIPGAEFLDTQGNNARAQDDIDGNDTGGTRPFGGPVLDFNPTFSLPNQPIANLQAGVLQAFYLVNLAHDVTYHYGFDELAGNFQFKNYTAPLNQAFDFDPVIVDVQDSAAFTNAFMATPPDGFSPDMTIGISFLGNSGTGLTPINPSRDIAIDATVVLHEFFHGVSNRLTGGPSNSLALQAIQSGGMGEGWSDWFGFVLTMKPTDNKFTEWRQGEYFLPPNGARAYPYSFDLTVNPRRLGDFNAPPDPTLPFPFSAPGSEVHNSGEIWAAALIDMTWLLVDKYGFDPDLYNGTGGNNLALQLVIDALKLQPPNPSFIEARDAIIAADLALTGGDNFNQIWEAMARRGIGASANSGTGSTSFAVAEAFDLPTPLGRVEGVVFNDSNGDGVRNPGELGLQGWTVYVDANNNGVLDVASERQYQSEVDGSYHFNFTGATQTITVRQIVQPNFKQTLPKNNAGRTVTVALGQTVSAQDFGNQGLPGEINGLKWNDLNGNGIRDTDALGVLEPGLAGVVIYADLNNDQKLNVLEPSTVTASNGRYVLKLPAGTYSIREVLQAGLTQTFPDPTGLNGFGHVNVILASSQVISLDFGNIASLDFGDAPDTYGTSLAANGPRHGILPGFRLGGLIDPEGNGQATADASGDDANGAAPDDEDGVSFGTATGIPSISPGLTKTLQVTVNTGGNSPGKLHGWVDFNRDGDFTDAGEKVVTNLTLGTGTHDVSFAVPVGVPTGQTFARFRYAYESNLGPTGAAQAGEVEDYVLNIQPNVPSAVADAFTIKQGTADNPLNVLANDPTTSFGPPTIVAGSFPAVIPETGSTLTLSGNQILYTPGPGVLGQETFTYTVTDGNSISAPGKVTITVEVRDPRAVDDVYTVASQAGAASPVVLGPGNPLLLANNALVLANDLTAHFAATRIVGVETLTTDVGGVAIPANTFSVFSSPGDPNSEKTLVFTPPTTNFTGTVVGRYTIIDDANSVPVTSQARVTVQVVNGVATPAASHLARLDVEILKLNPVTHVYEPATSVEAGGFFLARVTAQDLRPGGNNNNRGVESAYLDLDLILANPGSLPNPDTRPASFFASPVISVGHPLGLNIVFDGTPSGVTSTVQGGATATSFAGGATLDDNDDFYKGQNVVFTSGALQGQVGQVIAYNGTTHTFTFGTNTFTAAPAAGDTFRLDIPRYRVSQSGTANSPTQGDIDEAGATHAVAAGGAPVGTGVVTVFSVLMRANAATPVGQPIQILGDPADLDPQTKVILAGDFITDPVNPVDPEQINNIDDGKVFFKPSGPLTITGGAAEFTNPTNPFDVNNDADVSPLDALLIINQLNNSGGGQSLISSRVTATSASATTTYYDVNKDSQIAPIDALLVINFLNSLKKTATSGGEGESDAAAEAAAESAPADDTAAASAASAAAADEIFADLFRGRRRAR